MTNHEIANRLFELCSQSKFDEALDELFSADATSTEKNRAHNWETLAGIDALKAKGVQFRSMIEEYHGGHTGEPKVYGNYIFMEIGLDVTMKGMGRMNMLEMAEYEIKDGKIISEKFFY